MEPVFSPDPSAIEREAIAHPQEQIQPGPLPFDRLTFVGNVYHQPSEGEPSQVSLKFERLLETQEQIFQRSLRATIEWKPLVPERCWLQGDQIGLIVVRNDEGRYARFLPTPEEKEEAKGKVLEIAFRTDQDQKVFDVSANCLLVGPKECHPISAFRPELLAVRSRASETRYTVFIFPR